MKFSIRQILASAAGAVIAAVIASFFGVKGTIVGVAIGSAAATMATAFVAQSIERGHQAVKQVVVRAPDTATLLRKLGGTGPAVTRVVSGCVVGANGGGRAVRGRRGGAADTIEMASASAGETERLEISAVADAPAAERLRATTLPPARPGPRARRIAAVLLGRHRGNHRHRLRSGLALHHGHRADLGKAAGGHLRRRGDAGPRSTGSSPPRRRLRHAGDDHVHQPRRHRRPRAPAPPARPCRQPTGRRPRRPRRPRRRPRPRPPGECRRRRRRWCRSREGEGYQPLNSAGRRSTKLAMPSLESSVFVTSSCPTASS